MKEKAYARLTVVVRIGLTELLSVRRVDVCQSEGTDRVDLHHRQPARHRVVRVLGGNAGEVIAAERLHAGFVELGAHAGEKSPREHGDVLGRGMGMRRNLVAAWQ